MQRVLPIFLFALLGSVLCRAQNEAIFNHYVQNPILINPAAAGYNGSYNLLLNARAQWSGFDDSPKTIVGRVHGPVGESFGIGLGLTAESAAQLSRTEGQLDVSFQFKLGERGNSAPTFRGAFGFYGQYQSVTLDGGVMGNPNFNPGDPEIMSYLEGDNDFDAGVGFYGNYLENTFFGLTINNLVSNRLSNISGAINESSINYTALLGSHFEVEELGVTLTPSVLLRNIRDVPFQMDINVQASFLEDRFLAGLSYRNIGALGILLGTRIDGFQLYYGYDVGFGGLQSYSNGSHEITIGYAINRQDVVRRRERKAQESNRRR